MDPSASNKPAQGVSLRAVLAAISLLLLLPIALRPFQFGLGFLYN